jgi:hypothetical protein
MPPNKDPKVLKRLPIWVIAPLMFIVPTGLAPRQASAADLQQTSVEGQQTSGQAAVQTSAEDPPSASAEDPQRKKVADRISRYLGRLKPAGSAKKEQEDFFVVGTAKLLKATGHADVCFQVRQGQRATAEYLCDFMAGASAENPRDWRVFYRLKNSEQAEQALLLTRMQYDQMASYREDLKRQYQANSIRRC